MNIKKTFSIFLFFTIIVIAIMSPIASHDTLPRYQDYAYHLQNILSAHEVIFQSFPLRVASFEWFYPVFQFYAPSVYSLAGIVAFISHTPLGSFKITIGLCSVLGAWYCYRLYIFLFGSEIAALLGGVLYLFSPYLLININARGDFAETVTQGFLPISIYYIFRLFYEHEWGCKKIYFAFISILAFYVLATSHLITFIYSSLYIFMMFIVLSIFQKKIKNILCVFIVYCFALVLAAWYLIPLVHFEHILNIGANGLNSPWDSIYMTHLSTLLSPRGISFGVFIAGSVSTTFPLYPGLGLPVTMSVAYWFYRLYIEKAEDIAAIINQRFIKTIFFIFFVAFFMLWSPVNFWKRLPHEFDVLQFTYRLLTDIMWLGGILFVAMLVDFFKEDMNRRHMLIGFFCLAISGAGWLHNNYNESNSIIYSTLIKDDMLAGYNGSDYLVTPSAATAKFSKLSDNKLTIVGVADTEKNCSQNKLTSICSITVNQNNELVQLPILYYPKLLSIKVNGQKSAYYPTQASGTNMFVASVSLPEGQYTIQSRFTGLMWANRLSEIAWALYLIGAAIFCFVYWRYTARTK